MPRRGPITAAEQRQLDEIGVFTAEMRKHQEEILKLAARRRQKILRLHAKKVSYRVLAEAMGTTEQSVYKVLRGDL